MKRIAFNRARLFQFLLLALGVILAFVVAVGNGYAEEQQPQCGMGEVESTLQVLPVGFFNVNDRNSSVKMAGIGGGVAHCEYQLFFDGQTVTFHAADLILGDEDTSCHTDSA